MTLKDIYKMIYSVKVEKFHNDENRHTTYNIYKTAKLEWSNIVENFELVGLTNDLFMPDANHFCTGVSFFHRK